MITYSNNSKMKGLGFIGIIILIVFSSCNQNSHSDYQNQTTEMERSDRKENIRHMDAPQIKNRINDNITFIRAKVDKLNGRLADTSIQINKDAKEKSEKLKNDLLRIEQNLKKSLDSIELAGRKNYQEAEEEIQTHLEQAEDELSQINEELREWYDKNL